MRLSSFLNAVLHVCHLKHSEAIYTGKMFRIFFFLVHEPHSPGYKLHFGPLLLMIQHHLTQLCNYINHCISIWLFHHNLNSKPLLDSGESHLKAKVPPVPVLASWLICSITLISPMGISPNYTGCSALECALLLVLYNIQWENSHAESDVVKFFFSLIMRLLVPAKLH